MKVFSPSLIEEVPARVALHYIVFPLARENGTLRLAASRDLTREAKEELRIVLGKELEFTILEKEEIEASIARFYGVGAGVIETLVQEREDEATDFSAGGGPAFGGEVIDQDKKEDQTIIRLVNELFLDALHHRASDIHIEPFEASLRIRYRVDGILQEAKVSSKIKALAPSLISRIKIMARLDIGEKRLPQDGRIKISAKKPGGSATLCGGKSERQELDLRVSILPSPSGEAIVIRILKSLELLSLEELGFDPEALTVIRRLIQKPNGIILVTGPTGSGKTTTLYACLKEINNVERKIITIEDPIEYKLPGIIQMQVNTKIGFTFAKALRSMLRHDPDCLMVGEIRDQETAEIAIRSALTGHLVFSTLHTNDAPSAVIRLIEMGIEPYLVASSLEAVVAQRLVRKICPAPACRRVGCEKCQGSGYFGRTAVYELMIVTEALREMTLRRSTASELRSRALQEGMISLAANGKRKIEAEIILESDLTRIISA